MKRTNGLWIFSLIAMSVLLNSCKLMFPNRMFAEGNYEYFSVDQEVIEQYTIERGDVLTLEIYSREGFDLIDVLPNETGGGSSQESGGQMNMAGGGANAGLAGRNYLVEQDGYVDLPLFGRTYVLGYTENELEDWIEEKCAAIFNEPYAVLRVINRRAFVFKGPLGSVVSLNAGPTTLLEVIAKAGGIENDLKAYDIKVIRGDLQNPEIIKVDLSTMEGLKNANLIIQTNDVIYIEQRFRYAGAVLRETTPIVSLVSTIATLIVLINRL